MHIPFLSSLFHTRDKPQNYYIGTDFRYLFGPSTSGKMVNEFTAMQTTAVYACVRIPHPGGNLGSSAATAVPVHAGR